MQWEYKVVNSKIKSKGFVSPEPDANSFEATLNELGRQNWELVSCNIPSTCGGVALIYKLSLNVLGR
jgi:hypothetical protein